jgi:hypothetical protein
MDAIEAAQARHQRQKLEQMAAEVGLTADELLEEAEVFFRLSLDEQLREVDRIADALQGEGMSMDDVVEIKADLVRHYRPMA